MTAELVVGGLKCCGLTVISIKQQCLADVRRPCLFGFQARFIQAVFLPVEIKTRFLT